MTEKRRDDEQSEEAVDKEATEEAAEQPSEQQPDTETEEHTETKKEDKQKKREWGVLAIFLVLIVAAYVAYQAGYENVEQQTILRECQKIEQQIANSPAFQQANVTCNCAPGEQYFEQIQNQTPNKVVDKADLRYVVSCDMNGEQKLYPVWRADGKPTT